MAQETPTTQSILLETVESRAARHLYDAKLNYKPAIPYTYFYPSGKKRIVIRDKDDATEYSEDGRELGRGSVDPSGRKMGCWTIGGKKEYYMLDSPKPKLTPTQCQ